MLGALSSFVESRELNLQARFTLRKHIPAALQKPHLHDQIHSYFHEDHERAIIRLDTSYEHSPMKPLRDAVFCIANWIVGKKSCAPHYYLFAKLDMFAPIRFTVNPTDWNRLEPIGTGSN